MTTPTLFYEDGSPVPAEKAARARMGKSGTVGTIHSRGPCSRCGGAGGWSGWPGFTCYRCGGRDSQTHEVHKTKVRTREGLERLYAARERAEAKRQAKAERKAAKARAAFEAWAEDHADLVAALRAYEGADGFLVDLREHLADGRRLTERQVTAAHDALARAAAEAEAQPIPAFDGRVELELEVVSLQYRDSAYGTQLKMLGKHADGWKLWGTCPRALEDAGVERGHTVRFTAAVEVSDDDPLFGFFSRPTQAEVLDAAGADR